MPRNYEKENAGRDKANARAWWNKNYKTVYGWQVLEPATYQDTTGGLYYVHPKDFLTHATSTAPYYCARLDRSLHIPRTHLKRVKKSVRK